MNDFSGDVTFGTVRMMSTQNTKTHPVALAVHTLPKYFQGFYNETPQVISTIPNLYHQTIKSNTVKMSGNSSVGNSQVYEAGDQRPDPQQGEDHSNAYEEGKENSHQANDSSE